MVKVIHTLAISWEELEVMVTSMLLLLILRTLIRLCILQIKWEIKVCKNAVAVSRKIVEVFFKNLR
jgi:hypothetical protein